MARIANTPGTVGLALASLLYASLAGASVVTDISFSSKPGSIFEIKLDFDGTPPLPSTYTIEKPARIAMDFADTSSALERKKYALPYGNATGVLVLESGNRTRMIVNLVKLAPYDTRVEGNSLIVEVGNEGVAEYLKKVPESSLASTPTAVQSGAKSTIESLEFQRSESGEGRLILSLSNPNVDVNIFSEGRLVKIEFLETAVKEELARRYDVTDFATPVSSLELAPSKRGVTIAMEAKGDYDYLAYQTDNRYVVSVKPLTPRETEARKDEFTYVGERLSMIFQDVEVRTVLQIIAELNEQNLVASDTVAGTITLRLQNVPWDQALDLVLRTKGLDKRQVGNVLMVAPAAEIAERERQEIEANRQIAELAPLQSEFIRIRYANAADIVTLFNAGGEGEEGGSLVSPRGSVIVDERTNSLVLTETAEQLEAIRDLIELVDIPIRQVMIEARIVIAQSDVMQQLGIRWGGAALEFGEGEVTTFAGDLENVVSINSDINQGEAPEVSFPGALLVDLGVSAATGSLAIGYASNKLFLAAELSAMESAGSGEVVSQPKVITGDKQQAVIKSGTEIPYQESSASGASSTSFKEAVLALEVTPHITPDDRILLDLTINQDSVGDLVPSGTGGVIPSIDTTELTTQVLVGNGETVVLGGVFTVEDVSSTSKIPLLGDIPYMGRLFKRTTSRQMKTETLIFITPRILADTLLN